MQTKVCMQLASCIGCMLTKGNIRRNVHNMIPVQIYTGFFFAHFLRLYLHNKTIPDIPNTVIHLTRCLCDTKMSPQCMQVNSTILLIFESESSAYTLVF